MNSRTIDLPALCLRAELGAVDEEQRTVDVTFSTEAPVERYDWRSGQRYNEVLSMKPEHVRLTRLNSAGPLLDTHSGFSVRDMLGTVEPNSARIEKGKAVATLRFSKRDDVEPIWQDVKDRIIRSVSVGYRIYKIEEDTKKSALPTRTAIDWEPHEISMVPMPADIAAGVRSEDQTNTNPCVILARSGVNNSHEDAERLRRFRLLRAR